MFTMLLCAEHIIPIAGEPIDDGAVLVRDGRIVEVGGAQRMKAHYPQEEVRDFGRSAIMPGFVDCHTHLEYTALRGIVHDVPYAEWLVTEHAKADMMSRDDRYDSAVIGGMEMIAGGVTTVADFTSTGASFEAAQDVGLRGKFYRSVGATSKSQVDTAIEEAVADIERWRSEADSDRMQIGIAPKALHACHPTIFSKVNEVAEKLDLPVAMHVAGSYEEYSYIMRGSTPLSVRGIETGGDALTDRPMWLPTGVTPVNYALNWNAFNSHDVLAAHCVHVDDNDIAKLKEHDVAISVNTRCNAQLGMGLAPLPTFLKSGIRVRLGMLIHRSVDRDVFLTAKTMLELATIGGARALHMEDEIGTLEPGKRADITVVDLSGSRQTPLVDPVTAVVEGGAAADVMFTMVGGKPVYERGSKWDVRGNKWEMLINPAEARERGMQIRGKLRD